MTSAPLTASSVAVDRHTSPRGLAGMFWLPCCLLLLAAGILPVPAATAALPNPEDLVFLDGNSGTRDIVVISGGYSGTTLGTETVVASSTVGSGVTFPPVQNGTAVGVYQGCVSPAKQLYYWDPARDAFVSIDLTNAGYPRVLTPVPTNKALLPSLVGLQGNAVLWDFSSSTILYMDNGSASSVNGSTIARGIYRYNPLTGANTMVAPQTQTGAASVAALAVTPTGVIYGLVANTNETTANVVRINADGSYTTVDGGPNAYGTAANLPRYYGAAGLGWDIYNSRLNLYDEGDDQTTSRIVIVNPTTNTRAFLSNGSAGPAATRDATGILNDPGSGYTQTNGRLLYSDADANIVHGFIGSIPVNSSTVTAITAQNLGTQNNTLTFVPPGLPTLTTLAASGVTTTAANLSANVTSSGAAIVPPAVQTRGIVYAKTSANSNPTIGGTGVTNLAASAATGSFTVSASGLSSATTYSYAAYTSTIYGTTYSTVGTFTTLASAPTANSQSVNVAFNTATAITLTGSDTNSPAQTLTYSVATSPSHGTLSGTAPNLTYTPSANYQGADSFTFTTTNSPGNVTSNAATVSITVVAGTPTANAQSVSATFNTAKAIVLTGTDPDSPALSLTYTVTTATSHGTLSGTAPNLTYTPAANYQGADSFTFTVSNGQKTSSAATVSITVSPGTPTANSQSVVTPFNTAKAITLTGTDPDSPALSLTYTVLTAPTGGTLSGTAPGLTYTPTAGFSGADSFTFRVSNGTNTSTTATVSITVTGQPYITGFTPANGPVGTTVTITGSQFTGLTGVTFFRNVAATSFTLVSDTQITVTVPAGAASGTLRVTTSSGSNVSTGKFLLTSPALVRPPIQATAPID